MNLEQLLYNYVFKELLLAILHKKITHASLETTSSRPKFFEIETRPVAVYSIALNY